MTGKRSSRIITMQQSSRRSNSVRRERYRESQKENQRTDGSSDTLDYMANCIEGLLQNMGRLHLRNK
jgi:hypothetical protein